MKIKCLYLTLQQVIKNDGASEKSIAQNDAICNIGCESKLVHIEPSNSGWCLYVGDDFLVPVKNYRLIYPHIVRYIKGHQIQALYIRYNVNASFTYNLFLSRVAECGVKVYLEIPTYPYDGEVKKPSFRRTVKIIVEKFFRKRWKGKVYRIVTSSNVNNIYGIPTINISNAPAHILPIKNESQITDRVNFIAVANLAFWHGYDRLIRGLSNYYQSKPERKVFVTIAGEGSPSVLNSLKMLTEELRLGDYVKFIGSKSNDELNPLFEDSHLAIGCLGCHRKNIIEVKALKNVEYAMRGIPMVYSEDNSDFDGKPYVFKVPSDESDIDVQSLCDFVVNLKMKPIEIHETVKNMTWETQMKKVFAHPAQ